LIVVGWGIKEFAMPPLVAAHYEDRYAVLMFRCDQVMREHFIAKQMVLATPGDTAIRNLEAAEIGLTACHEYDVLRKTMIGLGVTENKLGEIGLRAIEAHAKDVRKFVEIHEIRY